MEDCEGLPAESGGDGGFEGLAEGCRLWWRGGEGDSVRGAEGWRLYCEGRFCSYQVS
jgi:hypothetical protein